MNSKLCPKCGKNVILFDMDMCSDCEELSKLRGKKPPIYRLCNFVDLGKSARDIYLRCCIDFGWDKSLANEFVQNRPLYADSADRTGKMAVWFICYSNLNKFRPDYITRENTIIDDGEIIEEYNPFADRGCKSHFQKRITFVKKDNGEYRFYGVYQIDSVNDDYTQRRFKRIAKDFTQ